MQKLFYLLPFLLLTLSWQPNEDVITGTYSLEVSGMKKVKTGSLEIVGEDGDYFGKIVLEAKKPRTFEIGLTYHTNDSLSFVLPGQGGYLNLKKDNAQWTGDFKYFGLEASVTATRTGPAPKELWDLVSLKPIGKDSISTLAEESFPSYDAKNKTLYFTRDSKIYFSKFYDSIWGEGQPISFSGDFNDTAPYLSPNGQTMIFTSNRPLPNSEFKKKNLWISYKTGIRWDKPVNLPPAINIDSLGDYHGGMTANGNFYFVSYNRPGGFGRSDIYVGNQDATGIVEVRNLGPAINTDKSEADVFIAPDESYLLFASTDREESFGADDIYISFNKNGQWSTPQNIGPKVNSYAYEYGAWVDEEEGYLYFNSYRRGTSDIYRVALSEISVFSEGK